MANTNRKRAFLARREVRVATCISKSTFGWRVSWRGPHLETREWGGWSKLFKPDEPFEELQRFRAERVVEAALEKKRRQRERRRQAREAAGRPLAPLLRAQWSLVAPNIEKNIAKDVDEKTACGWRLRWHGPDPDNPGARARLQEIFKANVPFEEVQRRRDVVVSEAMRTRRRRSPMGAREIRVARNIFKHAFGWRVYWYLPVTGGSPRHSRLLPPDRTLEEVERFRDAQAPTVPRARAVDRQLRALIDKSGLSIAAIAKQTTLISPPGLTRASVQRHVNGVVRLRDGNAGVYNATFSKLLGRTIALVLPTD